MINTRYWRSFVIVLAIGLAFLITQARTNTTDAGPRLQVLYVFAGGNDGAVPTGSLIEDANGRLFGTTSSGGGTSCPYGSQGLGCGTVFELVPTQSGYVEQVLYRFQGQADGAIPMAGLIADSSGTLYGTTRYGGMGSLCPASVSDGCGTVFKLTPHGSSYREEVLYSFQGSTDGAYPRAALVEDSAGSLYGTTVFRGDLKCVDEPDGCGTVFKLSRAGKRYKMSVLYRFHGGQADGSHPYAALFLDGDGSLYGTTVGGGNTCSYFALPGCGTVFRLVQTSSGYSEQLVYLFSGGHDGSTPAAALSEDPSGSLYGTAAGNGVKCPMTPYCGIVFKLAHRGSGFRKTTLLEFNGVNGIFPRFGVTQGKNGTLFAATAGGPSSAKGIVFRLEPNRPRYLERVLHAFEGGSDASNPQTTLLESHGLLFGTSLFGGNGCCGTVFAVKE